MIGQTHPSRVPGEARGEGMRQAKWVLLFISFPKLLKYSGKNITRTLKRPSFVQVANLLKILMIEIIIALNLLSLCKVNIDFKNFKSAFLAFTATVTTSYHSVLTFSSKY